MNEEISDLDALLWQLEAGIDECIEATPTNHFKKPVPTVSDLKNDLAQSHGVVDAHLNTFKEISNGLSSAKSGEVDPDKPQIKPLSSQYSESERVNQAAITAAKSASSIDELKLILEESNLCPLNKTATNIVFADGDSSSKIMFIGYVPAADDDRLGLPFQGANGNFFNKVIGSIGLDRTNSYLTNLLFWRPPGDRNPTRKEIVSCLPFTQRHIELISPQILVLLGGPVTQILLNQKDSITKMNGKWHVYGKRTDCSGFDTIPMHHPNNVIKSPIYKKSLWQALLEVRQRLSLNH